MSKLSSFFDKNRFSILSWSVTFVLVAGMLLGALRWKEAGAGVQALQPIPTAASKEKQPEVSMPTLGAPEQVAAIDV